MNLFGQGAGHDRQPAVAGSFYPAGGDKLRKELETFFSSCSAPGRSERIRAVIVPHAGYVYSGQVAAEGFAAVPAGADYDNIILLGCSHRYAFDGAAVFTSGNMITPLGTVRVNREAGSSLVSGSKWFVARDDVHAPEHSLEVELPFIQYHFTSQPQVIPVLLGTHNTGTLKNVAEGLRPLFNERNLFVISSDFSHYPSYADAVKVDRETADAIVSGDPALFVKTVREAETEGTEGLATAMCGWPAGLVLMYLTEGDRNLVYRIAGYSNSGDSDYGDRERVVGYNAIVVAEREKNASAPSPGQGFALTAAEQSVLIKTARDAISSALGIASPSTVSEDKLTARLKEPLGAFVTLTADGNLRGCIGRFTSQDPLYNVVSQMALEAAFSDPRFQPLTAGEYGKIKIEISVLGPMRKISDINEIVIGRDGIYIRQGYRSGTLLPQVAAERNWNVTEFLGYCSRDKAGIGWNGWKDKSTEIFVYEAYVFGEEKKH